ncbi:MAG: SIMPL domain-containing protein [Thiomonas sp.]|uniref:SIMPL domain-containing protein n=1 Tax=Thiomonas sp. TaxID=2047785 RepID=UPI002A363A57|nr:SIMPL domain-containing protein [Thiomonas sp.]MDY0331108.1 SIMPL domain-containing protein [Thiomonas sp.]
MSSRPVSPIAGLWLASLLFCSGAQAQSAPQSNVVAGVVDLQATAQVEVTPDLAVMHLAAERSGPDPASLTAQVSKSLEAALQRARAVSGVEASSGAFTTQPRWKTVNNQSQRDGWTVRAGLVLKSHDFAALGRIAGQLAQQGFMIESSGFELSKALRDREETALIESAIARFKAKAATAAHALGYGGYTLRTLQIEPTQGQLPQPRPMMMRAESMVAAESPAVPLATGRTPLQLTVQGSVQLTR